MADRLVDLQDHLIGHQEHVHRTGRAVWRCDELERLAGDPARGALEAEARQDFAAALLADAAVAVKRAGLRVANVFHAGDGNLHPLVLYDQRIAGQEHEAEELSGEIIRRCVAHGGSITGEHGVGMEKKQHMLAMFTEADLATHQLIRCAINPDNLCNPDKVYPTPRLCGEVPGPYQPHPIELAGLAERF